MQVDSNICIIEYFFYPCLGQYLLTNKVLLYSYIIIYKSSRQNKRMTFKTIDN